MPGSAPDIGLPVYFFVHVPKCAGTAVEAHFAKALGPGFMKAPRWESVLRNVVGNRYALTPERLAALRAAGGHSLSAGLARHLPAGRRVRECLLLREPVGWYLSFYNYRIGRHLDRGERRPPAFPLWYRAQRRNPVARFLLTRYFGVGYPRILGLSSRAQFRFLCDALARFHFVGDIGHAGEMVAEASAALGLPGDLRTENVGKVREATRESIGPAMVARIAAENAVDAALHRLWGGRRFGPGAPEGVAAAAAALPAGDQLTYVAADLVGTFLKKTLR